MVPLVAKEVLRKYPLFPYFQTNRNLLYKNNLAPPRFQRGGNVISFPTRRKCHLVSNEGVRNARPCPFRWKRKGAFVIRN